MILYIYKKIRKIIFLIIFFNNFYKHQYFIAKETQTIISIFDDDFSKYISFDKIYNYSAFIINNDFFYFILSSMSYITWISPDWEDIFVKFAFTNKFNWQNFLYTYLFVGFNYYDISYDLSSKINMLVSKDTDIQDEINKYKGIFEERKNKFEFLNYIFNNKIKLLFRVINIINISFHFIVMVLNFLYGQCVKEDSVFNAFKYNEDKMFHLFFRNYITINKKDYMNNITNKFNKSKPLLEYVKLNNKELTKSSAMFFVVNFFFKFNEKFQSDAQCSNFFSLSQLFFKTSNKSFDRNEKRILEYNLQSISYWYNVKYSFLFFECMNFFIQQKYHLEMSIKRMFELTNNAMKDIKIVFKKQNFTEASIRNFYLDSKQKKNIYNLLKKITQKIKNNKFNFAKFPPVFIYIIGDIGYGKTQMLNFLENYLRKNFDKNKIKYNKAVFLGSMPVLQNILKDYELQKVIPKALTNALSVANFILIEDINQLLPNRATSINIKKYMNISSFLTSINVGENNKEETFSGIVIGTVQKGNMLDVAVCRRGVGININIVESKKVNLKKFILIKSFLKLYKNENLNQFIKKYEIVKFIKNFFANLNYYSHYQINFLLENIIIYMKFFSNNINIIKKNFQLKRKKILKIIYKKLKNHQNINEEQKKLKELDKDPLIYYCLHNNYFNYHLISEFVKLF